MKKSWPFVGLTGLLWAIAGIATPALPPSQDPPEEIQRTEIITEARSPIDGKPLTAAQYAELQALIQARPETIATLNPEVRRIITLLRLRQGIRSIFPFLLR
ncbi:MAG: hypothetical protein MUF49_29730 [Oculatellaceae cyanobacterium Prado106]|jgi:hypothetical protein|nr:hypothetical protein [Oculatellaceae cyanobacterium Prado106]